MKGKVGRSSTSDTRKSTRKSDQPAPGIVTVGVHMNCPAIERMPYQSGDELQAASVAQIIPAVWRRPIGVQHTAWHSLPVGSLLEAGDMYGYATVRRRVWSNQQELHVHSSRSDGWRAL
jgi:hypothetical protein